MKKNNKVNLKLNHKKRLRFSVFLIGILIPFIALIVLLILQDNLFIGLIKNFHQEITAKGNLVSDRENWELLIPLVKSFRESNSYIFLSVGGFCILLSAIFSIVISGIIGKNSEKENDIEYNVVKDVLNKYKEEGFSSETKITLDTNNQRLNEIIDSINSILETENIPKKETTENEYDYKIIDLRKTIKDFKEKVSNLEKEKNEINNLYETEKEKNEILFSQIDKMKTDSEMEIKKALNNEEKSIDEILNKILYENEKKNKQNFDENSKKEKKNENQTTLKTNSTQNLLKLYNNNMTEIYKTIKNLCKKKEYEKALQKAIIELSEKEKRVPKFAYLIGYIYAKLNKNRDAKKYIAIVLSVEPNNIEARNLFGVIQYRMGNIKDAKQQFNMVLILDPENKTAKENVKRIKLKENKDSEVSLKKVIA